MTTIVELLVMLRLAKEGEEALIWLNCQSKPKDPDAGIKSISVRAVTSALASTTRGAESMNNYLRAAANKYAGEILAHAEHLAATDRDKGTQLLSLVADQEARTSGKRVTMTDDERSMTESSQ